MEHVGFWGLQKGIHKLQETAVGDGYVRNPAVLEFEVKEDHAIKVLTKHSMKTDGVEVQLTADGCMEVLVEDETAPFQLRIHKEMKREQHLRMLFFPYMLTGNVKSSSNKEQQMQREN